MPTAPVELETVVEVEVEAPTPEQLNDLWFGDSGWDCCWTGVCDSLRAHICDADEVPATDGLYTCCVPDIGQCPESLRPDDVDAGVE